MPGEPSAHGNLWKELESSNDSRPRSESDQEQGRGETGREPALEPKLPRYKFPFRHWSSGALAVWAGVGIGCYWFTELLPRFSRVWSNRKLLSFFPFCIVAGQGLSIPFKWGSWGCMTKSLSQALSSPGSRAWERDCVWPSVHGFPLVKLVPRVLSHTV